MTPLWNRETCLPVYRPSGSHRPQSDQIKPNQTMPPHFVCSRRSRLPSRWPSARTKAKNPAIKANRASSRQTPNFRSAPVPGPSKHQTCRRIVMPYPSIPPRPPETRNPQTETRFSANQAPIKAKTPVIVHDQGKSRHPQKNTRPLDDWGWELPFAPSRLKTPAIKAHRASSRQTPYFQTTIILANRPAGWGGSAGEWSNRVPRRNPLLGEMKQVRASVTTNQFPIAPTQAIKAKSPVIVRNQASSRQTMKKQTARSSANGAASYQPRATPWVCTPYATSPERAGQPPTKAQSRQKPL